MGRGEGREGRGRGQEPSRARDQPPEGATLKLLARRGHVRLLVLDPGSS